MRGPSTWSPLGGTRAHLVLLVLLVSDLGIARARTVDNSRHHHHHHRRDEVRQSFDGEPEELHSRTQPVFVPEVSLRETGNADRISSSDDLEKVNAPRSKVNDRNAGKSKITSPTTISASNEPVDQHGIRRFDAVVLVNEESGGKILANDGDKLKNRIVENARLDQTVTKGIIVRDGPSNDDDLPGDLHEIPEVKAHRKRSLDYANPESSVQQNGASVENTESKTEGLPILESSSSESLMGEKSLESAETLDVALGQPEIGKVEEVDGVSSSEVGRSVIPERVQKAEEKEPKEQVPDSRSVSEVYDENNQNGGSDVSKDESKVTQERTFDSSSLSPILNTNVSLEKLKSQAIALQTSLKDKAFLQTLKDQDILPEIPKFTEVQLSEALDTIATMKDLNDAADYSYLSKMDTSILSPNQLDIVKRAECLVLREQRQTFAENMMECIRGLSILNCMRIFVWPIIVDNIPASFSQNLPSLPIEVNVADWLPGRGETTSRFGLHQRTLVTPELLVSNILKDAQRSKGQNGTNLATFIDPNNETLSKLLTPGQLEILRMAETLLPETSRAEYAEKMNSCVRRFEYFSCVKYFAWPTVKDHFEALPDFPDYQSWYSNAGGPNPVYPILPYPGLGELPEVVEADATRTSHPKPETIIVQILSDTLKQTPRFPQYPVYHSIGHLGVPLMTSDQMAIFYTAEQLIPEPMRAEFVSKTVKCIRDYDYLTCTKYSTWPAVRQLYPGLPQFPDFSSWIPTFALPQLPDFSQYIPDFSSFFQNFPGLPGGSSGQQQPQQETQTQPVPDKPPSESTESPSLAKEEISSGPADPIENRIIQILSNVKLVVLPRNSKPVSSVTHGTLTVLNGLTYNQLRILALSKSVVPAQIREDLDSRLVGCLQGGSDFLNCTRNVIWPTLQSYVKDLPSFPRVEDTTDLMDQPTGLFTVNPKIASFQGGFAITPAIYQPIVHPQVHLAGRSPLESKIVAESEELPSPIARTSIGISSNVPTRQQYQTEKMSDSPTPVISITDARFKPIFSENPETVLLKILTNVRSSSKLPDNQEVAVGYLESLGGNLSPNQLSIIQASENLLPAGSRPILIEKMADCVKSSSFMICTRDILWPSVTQYYPRLPSFPNFIGDSTKEFQSKKVPGPLASSAAISETDVKTGHHGDAVVTITDTRFVPIFSQHPEELILGILKNLQTPSLSSQTSGKRAPQRSSEFATTFTDQQGSIITVAGNLLPESIRDVFDRRMTECTRESGFLECTRDIAWPTIAQFFPRLPNFPQIGSVPDLSVDRKPSQLPTLLPVQPETAGILDPTSPGKLGQVLPTENAIPISAEDEVETRIESILKDVSSVRKTSLGTQQTYLKDPLVGSVFSERQAGVIRMSEDLLPAPIKPIFIAKMVDCSRLDVFQNCIRNVGWPTLRQFIQGIPDFPDLGSYFPQIPQEIPQIPQFPEYPPQLPSFSGIELPAQGFLYPLRNQERMPHHQEAAYLTQGSLIAGGHPGGLFVNSLQGLTPSVDPSAASGRSSSSGDPFVVRGEHPNGWALSAEVATKKLVSEVGSEGRRKRSLEVEDDYQDISTEGIGPLNMTESEFLELLINLTQRKNDDTMNTNYFVESLNVSMKESLTADQYEILKMVQGINEETYKAGFMSRIIQCIRSLSFIRCMGIFVWPVISQNLPTFGFPTLGSFNPFGREEEPPDFQSFFGTTINFEKELLRRKEEIEGILVDWYSGLVESKFDKNYGSMTLRGYGDGEIGISFKSGRTGRAAKIKDNKNLPSILTIISDIMEDMLEQRDPRPEVEKRREQGKSSGRSRVPKSLFGDPSSIDDSNEIMMEKSRQDSTNDDRIIAMFLDKLAANGSDDETSNEEMDNQMNPINAYEAFELLFGTKLNEKMTQKLDILEKSDSRLHSRKLPKESNSQNESDGQNERSGLIIRLPRIDDDFLNRKLTTSLTELGRKMKDQMMQMAPGMSFLISFFAQMMLAHAKAAASVAGMMSNMALASAMFSMIRQTLFGSTNSPKVKYVYDNSAVGPGITWPHYYHKP